ncbi:MAG: hypothetical protein NT062_21480 [Proteobacteria bacterium]|nr:hypothetical protein [Pseudomonadota bacterium]
MADTDVPKAAAEPPKPVHIGGESFLDRLLPHLKKIMFAGAAIAAVAAIVFGVRAFKQRGQKKETVGLASVLELTGRDLRGSAGADPNKPTFVDTKERSAAVLDGLTKAETSIPGPAFKAGLLFDTGKFDEAITEYKTCTAVEGIEGVLCREGLGLALEAKADATTGDGRTAAFQAALDAFKAMQPADDGLRAAYAHYHQGRMLLILTKRDEAKAQFEKAKELGKNTADLPDLIEKRLAALASG